jgi:hypothetical protein
LKSISSISLTDKSLIEFRKSFNINPDYVYIETFSKFNNAQVSLFNQLGINDDGVIGKAKAK